MTKLLHLQLLPLLSGVQNFSLHLLDGLPRDEFDIYVASAPGGDLVEAVRQRGYKHIPLRFLRHPISPLDAAATASTSCTPIPPNPVCWVVWPPGSAGCR